MTLTLRSAANAAGRARATKIKNEAQSARITILLFTRKGLRLTVCAGLLALRVRMLERQASGKWPFAIALASGFCRRSSQDSPGDQLRFSRLQLRGSAGFAPASLSSLWTKTRKPKDISKNGK